MLCYWIELTTTYSDHEPQLLLVPWFSPHKNVHKPNLFICDWKTFNNDTWSSDYKSTDWPKIIQKDERILIFLFTITSKKLEKWYQVTLLWELSPLANESSKMVSLWHHTVPEPFLKFFFFLVTGVQSEVPKSFLSIYHHLTKIYFPSHLVLKNKY